MENQVVAPIMHKAKQRFLNQNRDLVALVQGGANKLFQAISADMMLDDDAEIAINDVYREMTDNDVDDFAGNALTHENDLVRSFATGTLEHAFYKQLCLAFLRLRARGAFVYTIKLTPEAAAQEFQVEVDSGCRLPQAAIERQARQQTAAENLDAEITADWNGRLRTDQIRDKKKSNPQYGARFYQLLNEGKL